MRFFRVQIRKFGFNVSPLLERRSFLCRILCRKIRAFLVKYGIRIFKPDKIPRFFLLLVTKVFLFKTVLPETAIIIANTRSVIQIVTLFELPKIILKLFLENSLGIWISHLCFIAVSLIHLPGCLQGRAVFFFKYVIRVDNEIVEIIGRPQHDGRNIAIVGIGIIQVNLLAMISDGPQFKIDLFHYHSVFIQ